ncbi:hypothetical protein LX69_01637 [Breznakibacter xylanolyticus]|uniref:Transmembrane protein n=1 Tax=Breznakibacter xylanolyticus TaxID=990 RepID=A0A2W7NAZ9_9BACT|nr:DUF6057 family protein [Breznakibacter xylanolyticus]PZX16823.1 hypothetical protein LX69_01637 [Breznakibacter xylanolyticus]
MISFNSIRHLRVGLLLGALVFLFYQFAYPHHLYFKEQNLLFLWDISAVLDYMSESGWLAHLLGDFFTQFFYLQGGGALVLTFWLMVEWWLVSRMLRDVTQHASASWWAVLPVMVDAGLHTSLLHGLEWTMAVLLGSVFYFLLSFRLRRWGLLMVSVLLIMAGWWLCGAVVLVAPLMWVMHGLMPQKRDWWRWLLPSLVVAVLLPLAGRYHYLQTIRQAYVCPSLIADGWWVIVALVSALAGVWFSRFQWLQRRRIMVGCIVLLGVTAGVVAGWCRADFEGERIHELDNLTYFGRYEEVLEIVQRQGLKSRHAIYFANLAMSELGILGDSLMTVPQPATYGLMLPVAPGEGWVSILFSNEVHYRVGDMNMTQHAAMLGNTFSPRCHNSRMMRRLAEVNLAIGDTAAAGKYLGLLEKTLFHCRWAQTRLSLPSTSYWLREMHHRRALLPVSDTIRRSNDFTGSLGFLISQNPRNVVAVDYLLCYHLLNKDLASFHRTYVATAQSLTRKMPQVYAEALLLYLYLERATPQQAAAYQIPAEVVSRFPEYLRMGEDASNNAAALTRRFGKSYWMYYHFARLMK